MSQKGSYKGLLQFCIEATNRSTENQEQVASSQGTPPPPSASEATASEGTETNASQRSICALPSVPQRSDQSAIVSSGALPQSSLSSEGNFPNLVSSQGSAISAITFSSGTSLPGTWSSQGTVDSSSSREWLENVLAATFKEPAQIMKEHLEMLQENLKELDESDNVEEVCENLGTILWSLLQHTDRIDNAVDFHKIGGFDFIRPLLKVPGSRVKTLTLELIGDLVQNNDYCQAKATEAGLLSELFEILDTGTEETVCIKALYAISCLSRHNESILNYIVEADGFSKLMRAIQKPSERLRTKTAFLLTHLCYQIPSCKDILCDMGLIQLLVYCLQGEFHQNLEHVLSCLLALLVNHGPSQEECLRPELRLKDTLLRIKMLTEENPECLEIRDYVDDILKYCEPSAISSDEEKRDAQEAER